MIKVEMGRLFSLITEWSNLPCETCKTTIEYISIQQFFEISVFLTEYWKEKRLMQFEINTTKQLLRLLWIDKDLKILCHSIGIKNYTPQEEEQCLQFLLDMGRKSQWATLQTFSKSEIE